MRIPLLFACFAVLAPCASIAQSTSTPLEIVANEVNVEGLALVVAEKFHHNVAIGGYADRRANFNASFSSFDIFLERVAKIEDGRVTRHPAATIITSSCVGQPPATTAVLAPDIMGLRFSRQDPGNLLTMLYMDSGSRTEGGEKQVVPSGSPLIGISVRDTTLTSLLEVITLASGVELLNTKGRTVEMRTHGTCPIPSPEATKTARFTCARSIPELGAKYNTPCEPLEFYKLENITLRGYFRVGSNIRALAETPDGATWSIRIGESVGLDYGIVSGINKTGITINELVKKPDGMIYERILDIDYQTNQRKARLERRV